MRTIFHFLLAGPVMLILLTLSILRFDSDYTASVNINWDLDLPASEDCLYETDSGASFHGDGLRYHVLAYGAGDDIEAALSQQASPLTAPPGTAAEIMEELAVPTEERPDMETCRWYTSAHPTDDRNRLYLGLDADGLTLYVIESFF